MHTILIIPFACFVILFPSFISSEYFYHPSSAVLQPSLIFFRVYNKMGNFCGTDIYKQIKEEYPNEFSKYLVGEELKKGISQQIDSTKSKVTATANDIQKENLGLIDSKESEVKNHFEQAKEKVEKYYLGGVKGLEQTHNAKAEDILGLTAIQQQFKGLKDDVTHKFNQEKESAQAQLLALEKQQTSKIAADQPQVPLFDQLSDKIKNEVYESGVKDYKDKIQAQTKAVLGPIHKQLQPDNFISRFKNLLPVDNLKNLTKASTDDIDRKVQSLVGHPEQGRAYLG